MNIVANKTSATGDHSNKNFQNESFKDQDLSNVNFSGSDLRGADFSGANLGGADFTGSTTGITSLNRTIIFLGTLVFSLVSAYFAMLAGRTIESMLKSGNAHLGLAGVITMVLYVVFIAYAWARGGNAAIRNLIIPTCLVALLIGLVAYFTQAGTGMGMFYLILCNILLMAMFVVGTIAITVAGTLSGILFVLVAVSGVVFGKTLGGDIGTVALAAACFLISRRALAGSTGFRGLRKISFSITRKFGTSFRNANLAGAKFSESKIHNADFTNADLSSINWGNAKKVNCIFDRL